MRLTTLPPSCAERHENLGAYTSWNPLCNPGPVTGLLYPYLIWSSTAVLTHNGNYYVMPVLNSWSDTYSKAVFLNRRVAARYRALASNIPGSERPGETTICYKISLVKLITNLNIILYLSTCHTVYISVLILFMIMP